MRYIKKGLTALLIITLTLFSLNFMVMNASCADPPAPTATPDIPVPSVPQFTLTYADHSYDVPAKTTSSTDPYTGKVTTTTIAGYHVQNYTVDIQITNQPYPSTINNGQISILRYFIQVKGHYESESSFYISGDGNIDGTNVVASNSEYTVVSIPLGDITEGAIDVRIKASLGYYYNYFYGLTPEIGWASADSDLSAVQTLTLSGSPVSPSSIPELNPLTILPLLMVIPFVMVLLFRKNSSKIL